MLYLNNDDDDDDGDDDGDDNNNNNINALTIYPIALDMPKCTAHRLYGVIHGE